MADFAALAKKAEDQADAPPAAAAAPTEETEVGGVAGGEGNEGEAAPEEESTAHFEPVVQLEEVEVKTHEEDEECLFKMRAKLFVFSETLLNKGTGNKSWNERGVGDVKFLRHKEHQKIRVLMRQERTMKLIANHIVDPRIVLVPNAGSDRSWVWTAFDFAEGGLTETTFAIRFGTSENAAAFKEKYEETKQEMEKLIAGEDAEGGAAEADEAAAAIESLSVGKDAGAENATEES